MSFWPSSSMAESATRSPAYRLPLSTVETKAGCKGSRVRVSYQL